MVPRKRRFFNNCFSRLLILIRKYQNWETADIYCVCLVDEAVSILKDNKSSSICSRRKQTGFKKLNSTLIINRCGCLRTTDIGYCYSD